jgi:arginine decarboxylase
MYVPRKMFLTKGVGYHKEKLASFEMALRNANIAPYNIVEVSSILPPGCIFVSANEGIKELIPGQILHMVISKNATNEPNRLIGASVGVAIPRDKKMYGYLSEHHSFGQNEQKTGDYAEELAATMLITIIGEGINVDSDRGEKKNEIKTYEKIFRTRNMTQTAVGDKNGLWTTVIAASVLLP